VCEDLAQCASELNCVTSDFNVVERFLKVINDTFRASLVKLEMRLKIAQAEMGQEEKIEE